jgi:tripartite-type tricarboxylate transporter receptor subunit TctC
MLVVHAALPYKTVVDVVMPSKAKPEALNFGSGRSGTSPTSSEPCRTRLPTSRAPACSYKGGVQALNDVLAYHLDMIAADLPSALPQIPADELRAAHCCQDL